MTVIVGRASDGIHHPRLRARGGGLGHGADQHRRLREVLGSLGASDHDRARAVGLEAEVEHPQRRRDHPRREVVVDRHRAIVHLRTRVGVGPLPAGDRDLPELLGRRAELDHVPLGEHGEHLARREQPVRHVQLVVAAATAHGRAGGRRHARSADRSGRSAHGTPAPWSPGRTGSRRPPGRPCRRRATPPGRPRPSRSRWAGRSTRRGRGGTTVSMSQRTMPSMSSGRRPASAIAASAAWVASVRSLRPELRL